MPMKTEKEQYIELSLTSLRCVLLRLSCEAKDGAAAYALTTALAFRGAADIVREIIDEHTVKETDRETKTEVPE